jgi:hypothetical protein
LAAASSSSGTHNSDGSGSGYLLFADKERPSILVQDGDEVELLAGQGKWQARIVKKRGKVDDKDDDGEREQKGERGEWCLRLERVECKDDREERRRLCIANRTEELARRKEEIEALKKDVEALTDRCAEVHLF